MKIIKRVVSTVMVLTFVFALTGMVCAAEEDTASEVLRAEDIDMDAEMSLTVYFIGEDGEAVSDAVISIYKVADVYTEGYGVYYTAITGGYDYAGLTASESNEIAAELAENTDEIKAATDEYYTGTTGKDGSVTFTGLTAGIYLVVHGSEDDYTFDPYLACVPLAEEEDGMYVWNYSVVSYPKNIREAETETETESETDETETDETETDETEDETETGTDGTSKKSSSGSSSSSSKKSSGSSSWSPVKTGDEGAPPVLWLIFAAAALGALAFVINKQHREKGKQTGRF